MIPSEYQKLAERTETNQNRSLDVISNSIPVVRLLQGCIGLIGDLGELASALERHAFYRQPLDVVNMKEEVGDCLWYLAQICNALELDMEEVMEANIRKLQIRYPEKFDESLSKEVNRNRKAERDVL